VARTSPPMATEILSNRSPPVQFWSGDQLPLFGREDWTAQPWSHCHFGTNPDLPMICVALARYNSEIVSFR